MDESVEKERLSNSEFAELISHLPLQDLLLIEYRIDDWKFLINAKDSVQKLYGCAVCGVAQSGIKNLYAHIDGKKHKIKMQSVKQLYHPEYTYEKSESKLVVGCHKQTPNVINKSTENTKQLSNSGSKKALSNRPNLQVISLNKKPVSSKTQPVENSALQQATIMPSISTEGTDTVVDTEFTASSENLETTHVVHFDKVVCINDQSTDTLSSPTNAKKSDETEKAKLLNNDDSVVKSIVLEATNEHSDALPDVCLQSEERALLIRANSSKGNLLKETKTNSSKMLETNHLKTTSSISCVNQITDEAKEDAVPGFQGNPLDMVKNPFAINPDRKADKMLTEVIIIDEEDDEVVEEKTIENDKRTNSSENLKQPPAKRQKTSPNMAKAPDKIVNAQKVASSVGEESVVNTTEKSRYQSNIIIVPTVDKNKNRSSNSQMSKKVQPTFATKTFSCKLSDDKILGLIGVEYVIKILKSSGDLNPRFECGLCELILDGFGMQDHLMGYNHRLKFCEKHFPTAIRQYQQYIGKFPEEDVKRVMLQILEKLAVAIEQHHGRDLPYECLERDFNINRHEILSKVFSCRHASEQYGPTFTHVVNSKDVEQLVATRHNFVPQKSMRKTVYPCHPGFASRREIHNPQQFSRQHHSVPELYYQQPTPKMYNFNQCYPETSFATSSYRPPDGNYAPVDDATHKLMVDDFLKGNNRSFRSDPERETERYHRPGSRSRLPVRSPKRSRSGSFSKLSHDENTRKSLSPLRDNDIWQAYRHLVDQKVNDLNELFGMYRKDPEMHPLYNEEWEKFWKRRKEELITAGLDHRTYNYQPEWVRFFNARVEELYVQALENIKIESRERLCLPMTNDHLTDSKYHVRISENIIMETSSVQNEIKQKPEIVSVLRLMTALEEHLGSLGPKIIELLSKALQAEKCNPDKINKIVLTPENCTLLETAMEKFKGLLIAGFLEGAKERALKKAVEEIQLLLDHSPRAFNLNEDVSDSSVSLQDKFFNTTSVKSKPADTIVLAPSQKPPISRIIAQADKKELAARLAALLTAQGKSDIDPEQLQQILSLYMLIEKKKQETNCVVDTRMLSTPTQKSLADTLAGLINSTHNSNQIALPNRNITGCVPSIGQFSVNQSNRNQGADNNSWNYVQQDCNATTSNNFRFGPSNQAPYPTRSNFKESENLNLISAGTNLYRTNRFNPALGGSGSFSNSFSTLTSGSFLNTTSNSNIYSNIRNDGLMSQQGRPSTSIPQNQQYNSSESSNITSKSGPNRNFSYNSNCERGASNWR